MATILPKVSLQSGRWSAAWALYLALVAAGCRAELPAEPAEAPVDAADSAGDAADVGADSADTAVGSDSAAGDTVEQGDSADAVDAAVDASADTADVADVAETADADDVADTADSADSADTADVADAADASDGADSDAAEPSDAVDTADATADTPGEPQDSSDVQADVAEPSDVGPPLDADSAAGTDAGEPADADAVSDTAGDSGTELPACVASACPGDGNPCSVAVCISGSCAIQAAVDGSACSDGDGCTSDDACTAGKCKGKAIACNDNDQCTIDTCKQGACAYDPQPADFVCNDDNACTSKDVCTGGACAGVKITCDDKNPCTADGCVSGTCKNVISDSLSCEDGDACTLGDSCAQGLCIGGKKKDCDDNNACTVDSCASGSCVNTAQTGPACSDGDDCTLADSCLAGVCKPGQAKNCDDANACTDDSCSKGICASTANTAPCNDGEACSIQDSCSSSKCGGKKVNQVALAGAQCCDYMTTSSMRRHTFAPASGGGAAIVGDAKCNSVGYGSVGSVLLRVGADGNMIGQPALFWNGTPNEITGIAAVNGGFAVAGHKGTDSSAKVAVQLFDPQGQPTTELILPYSNPSSSPIMDVVAAPDGAALVAVRGVPNDGKTWVEAGTVVERIANGAVTHKLQAFSQLTYGVRLHPTSVGCLAMYQFASAADPAVSALTWTNGALAKWTNNNLRPSNMPGQLTALGGASDGVTFAVAGYVPPGGPGIGKAWLTLFNGANNLAQLAMVTASGSPILLIPYTIVPGPDNTLLVAGMGENGPNVLQYNLSGVLLASWTMPNGGVTELLPSGNLFMAGILAKQTQISFGKFAPAGLCQ